MNDPVVSPAKAGRTGMSSKHPAGGSIHRRSERPAIGLAIRALSVASVVGSSWTPCIASRRELYPSEVRSSVWWQRLPADEPALSKSAALSGYKSRIRLTISGGARLSVVIRIDERIDGRQMGRITVIDRAGRASLRSSRRSFTPNQEDNVRLQRLIVAARLWSIYPEHWIASDPEQVCIDGEQLVFERLDGRGYRFSEANAQCTAPPALLAVARAMIAIAGQPRLLKLLD